MKVVKTEEELDAILEEGGVVVVDFFAPWCTPCLNLGKLLNAYSGETKIVKVDCDDSPELAQKFGVRGIPYVAKFQNGEKVDEFTGLISSEQLDRFLG